MTDRDLSALLQKLHDALASRGTLDPEDEALAALVRADLDRTLEKAAVAPDAALAPKLESAIERFEGQHPELVEAARRVLDQLANVGI